MKRYIGYSLAVINTVVLAVAGAGCSGTAPQGTAESYRIGALLAVTGNNSPLGTPEKQTIEMMVDQINKNGGINGHPLDVIIYDTKSDTTECVTQAKKLIEQDKVLAIIGPSSTGESMALVDMVTRAGVPLISCAASAQIVEPVAERKWVFKTAQSDILAINEIVDYLNGSGIKKVALLCDSAGFGQTGHTALIDVLPRAGLTIVADEKFGSADTDMTSQLTKIRGTDAQAVICWGTNPGPAMVAKGMKQLGVTIPLINSHGIANLKFIELAGDAADGVILPAGKLLVADQLDASDSQKAVLAGYKADFEEIYGPGNANSFGGYAYDGLSMVVQAISSVGADRAKIRGYIENNVKDVPGVSGVFNMSPADHNGLGKGAFVMIKIVDGKWTWLK